MKLSDRLFEEGVFAQGIGFPTVPDDRSRVRTIVTAEHTREELETCLAAFENGRPGARADLTMPGWDCHPVSRVNAGLEVRHARCYGALANRRPCGCPHEHRCPIPDARATHECLCRPGPARGRASPRRRRRSAKPHALDGLTVDQLAEAAAAGDVEAVGRLYDTLVAAHLSLRGRARAPPRGRRGPDPARLRADRELACRAIGPGVARSRRGRSASRATR